MSQFENQPNLKKRTQRFNEAPAQRLVLAAAAAQARRLRLKTTLLARGAYPKRRSRCPLQTVLAPITVYQTLLARHQGLC